MKNCNYILKEVCKKKKNYHLIYSKIWKEKIFLRIHNRFENWNVLLKFVVRTLGEEE